MSKSSSAGLFWFVVGGLGLVYLVSTSSRDALAETIRPCLFMISGEQDWFFDDLSWKPHVYAELASVMDTIIAQQPGLTAQLLAEAAMRQYNPDCSMMATVEAVKRLQDEVSPEAYAKQMAMFDAIYSLAQSRIDGHG